VSGGGWKGLAVRWGAWKTLFMSAADVLETRLARDCEREDAVDWNCDCIELLLFVLLFIALEVPFALDLGLASVFSRRITPDTAYEIGYVKYDDERCGVEREGGDEEGREDCEESVVVGIE
jgi:hypothetical protein